MNNTNSKKPKKKALYYVILAVLFAVIVYSVYMIIDYVVDQRKSAKNNELISEQYLEPITGNEGTEDDSDDDHGDGTQKEEVVVKEPESITVDFTSLCNNYPNCIGYIYCANTVSYPIMKYTDNDYYLTHDVDGTTNKSGCIFMEYTNSSDFSDATSIIYGHHMKSGRMFAHLLWYRDSSYYKEHPYMYIYTPTQNYKLNLFAGFLCDATSDTSVYQRSYTADEIEDFMSRSTFKSIYDTPTGRIVTLSTCSYTGQYDDERYVLMGELVPCE